MRGFRTRRMARGRMDSAGGGFLRGVNRSRRNGAWDMRRGPRPATIARERWMAAFMAHAHAMAARTL